MISNYLILLVRESWYTRGNFLKIWAGFRYPLSYYVNRINYKTYNIINTKLVLILLLYNGNYSRPK